MYIFSLSTFGNNAAVYSFSFVAWNCGERYDAFTIYRLYTELLKSTRMYDPLLNVTAGGNAFSITSFPKEVNFMMACDVGKIAHRNT